MNKPTSLILGGMAVALPLGCIAACALSGTRRAAAEADAFLATLSEPQRKVAQVELALQLAAKWSNFPAVVVPRNGVYFRDLTAEQSAAALKIARLALSKEGFDRFQGVHATTPLPNPTRLAVVPAAVVPVARLLVAVEEDQVALAVPLRAVSAAPVPFLVRGSI